MRSPFSRTAGDSTGAGSKSIVGILFLILFIDLVGFSIIFPLFPAMLDYYLERPGSGLITWLVQLIESISGQPENRLLTAVLFGGILGSLYSLLQFLSAPFWGILSDRFGRRPILLVTVAGTGLSYLLWIFSASFEGLIAARLLGGLMAGNISVATAAIADTTSRQRRGSGMALVGIAFGLGFVLGPAIGGLSAGWHPGTPVPPGEYWGWHPFSGPALIAAVLATINFVWVLFRLPETLPLQTDREKADRPLPHQTMEGFRAGIPGIRLTIRVYFVLLIAFSGMEFTLTFLAVERFQYTPVQNGMMFVYIGLVLAAVQGGITRRLIPRIGERRVARAGLVAGFLAFLLLAWCGRNVAVFYLGLGLMSASIGLASPALQSLVSLYADERQQGKYLGLLRSAGALARALGPILAAAIFFSLGSPWAYTAGAAILILPLLLARRLPRPSP